MLKLSGHIMSVIVAALAVATIGGAPARAAPPGAQDAETFVATCSHYDNRARFHARVEPVTLVAALAEACAEARATLERPEADAEARAAAQRFLKHLHAARAEISRINSARTRIAFAAREAGLGPPQRRVTDLGEAVGIVSPAGEYLILRLGGTLSALEDWVAAGARFPGAGAFR